MAETFATMVAEIRVDDTRLQGDLKKDERIVAASASRMNASLKNVGAGAFDASRGFSALGASAGALGGQLGGVIGQASAAITTMQSLQSAMGGAIFGGAIAAAALLTVKLVQMAFEARASAKAIRELQEQTRQGFTDRNVAQSDAAAKAAINRLESIQAKTESLTDPENASALARAREIEALKARNEQLIDRTRGGLGEEGERTAGGVEFDANQAVIVALRQLGITEKEVKARKEAVEQTKEENRLRKEAIKNQEALALAAEAQAAAVNRTRTGQRIQALTARLAVVQKEQADADSSAGAVGALSGFGRATISQLRTGQQIGGEQRLQSENNKLTKEGNVLLEQIRKFTERMANLTTTPGEGVLQLGRF